MQVKWYKSVPQRVFLILAKEEMKKMFGAPERKGEYRVNVKRIPELGALKIQPDSQGHYKCGMSSSDRQDKITLSAGTFGLRGAPPENQTLYVLPQWEGQSIVARLPSIAWLSGVKEEGPADLLRSAVKTINEALESDESLSLDLYTKKRSEGHDVCAIRLRRTITETIE